MVRKIVVPSDGESLCVYGKNYTFGTEIGSGGFATVVACQDDWGNRLAAKILRPNCRSYDVVKATWLDELHKLAELRHPNITFVYDAFEWESTFFIIMERCDWSLRKYIEWHDLEGEIWIKPIARGILQAIEFIHACGYVHKDLHPGNILTSLSYDDVVPSKQATWQFKVADLGISRLIGDVNVFNTQLARWMLPPEYLDPSSFGTVSQSTDIYHVGMTFLSILCGKTPTFTVDEILGGAPRQMAEELQSRYSAPIAKALRRHVASRTPTAIEFWRELAACG